MRVARHFGLWRHRSRERAETATPMLFSEAACCRRVGAAQAATAP
ncbi:hypothetical protein GLA29479_1454 [Lysobacter antibioticus]|nr:hypothetical protein GLA29479_1454 [Lysobacter antibioticus]